MLCLAGKLPRGGPGLHSSPGHGHDAVPAEEDDLYCNQGQGHRCRALRSILLQRLTETSSSGCNVHCRPQLPSTVE